jgi:non-ribosomal peptide synthase protein (TIGR01720 family)
LADLRTAYEQLSRGESIVLGDRTTSYKRWAELLQTHSESPALLHEASYWASQAELDFTPLPFDLAAGPNTVESVRTLTVGLDASETKILLRRLPELFNIRLDEVLLAALVLAMAVWTGKRHVWVDIEGHGREDLFEGVDLSRTVGWFTTIYPLRFSVDPADAAENRLLAVKEQLRAVPNRGIGFGMLRYLCGDEKVKQSLQKMPQPEIGFNYLGQFGDDDEPNVSEERLAVGSTRSPKSLRRHQLEINGHVFQGRLNIDFGFSENVHRQDTIGAVAKNFVSTLGDFVSLGQSSSGPRLTASDFARAKLSERDFGKLVEQLEGRRKRRI